MNGVSDFPGYNNPVEESRQRVQYLLEEITRLSELEVEPAEYYGEVLKRVMMGLVAPAGAVWSRTSHGQLQLSFQINMGQVGLEEDSAGKAHDALLRQAFQQGRPFHSPAQSSPGAPVGEIAVPGNPTNFDILLAPMVIDRQVVGLVEIWQDPNSNRPTVGFSLQLLMRVACLAAIYNSHHQRREMANRQRLWAQLESFARQIHSSLKPAEVAYTIANEGRRLVACDRISITLRRGKRAMIEGVSGSDVVEKRSNLIRLMRILFERVFEWGEKLVFNGTKDQSLPPRVLKALEAYLAESHSQLLVVLPLRDEREGTNGKPPRSALMMESFELTETPEKLIAQLEVIGRHAGPALFNATEYRRIPLRWIWKPLAHVQEGMGGPARVLTLLLALVVGVIVAAMICLPYPLRMDAQGQLLPQERYWIYSPVEGRVVRFAEGVQPGQAVSENQSLVLMYDVQLELKLVQLNGEIAEAEENIAASTKQEAAATTETDRLHFASEKKQKQCLRDSKILERKALRERTHSEEARPGQFWLKAPLTGTVLNWDFRENLTNRYVKPSEPLLRLGNKERYWEIELKIPQKHIGQVLQAFDSADPAAELDVDLLLSSFPTRTFSGKLARSKVAGEAIPNRDSPTDSEPVVLASVRLEGPGIDETHRVPRDLLVTGTEVHTKICCGRRPLGYSLFYGVGEFFYEKVIFYFMSAR